LERACSRTGESSCIYIKYLEPVQNEFHLLYTFREQFPLIINAGMKKCISFHRLNFKTCIQFGCKAYQRTLKKRLVLKKKNNNNNTFPEDSVRLTYRPWPTKSISLKTHLLDVLKME